MVLRRWKAGLLSLAALTCVAGSLHAQAASFVLLELDASGALQRVFECGGSRALQTEMISTTIEFASAATSFEVSDGTRIRGRIERGEGWCGEETWCSKPRDFMLDVQVQPCAESRERTRVHACV